MLATHDYKLNPTKTISLYVPFIYTKFDKFFRRIYKINLLDKHEFTL